MMIRFIAAIGLILISLNSFAETPIYSWDKVKQFSNSSLRSGGDICYALSSMNMGLPCNPAMTAFARKSQFKGDLMWGQQINYIDKAQSLLNNDMDLNSLQSILLDQQISNFFATADFMYLQETLSFSVEPSKWIYFSQFHNPVMPHVTLLAVNEQNIKAQLASFIEGPWSWGVQLRATQRKLIERQFYFYELMGSEKDSILTPLRQSAIYIEPGVMYEFENMNWAPLLSLSISNIGLFDHQTDVYRSNAKYDFGFSVKPIQDLGILELGVHQSYQIMDDSLWAPTTFGISYQIASTLSYIFFNQKELGAGVHYSLSSITTGLSIVRKDISVVESESQYDNQWLVHFGVAL